MAKKVKCIECDNCMNWALPANVNHENINHAKHCLDIAKRTVVCGWTMKTKRRDNEQYCEHFVIAERSKDYFKQLEELEKKIERYEKKVDFVIDEKKLIEERPEYLNPNRLGHEEYNKGWNACNDMWFKLIKAQPKVGEWIPCKRELPKTNGVYQITRELMVDEDIYRISDSAYFDGQDTWHNDNRYNHVRLPLTDIVAWKPIDEPYKEEVQNDL